MLERTRRGRCRAGRLLGLSLALLIGFGAGADHRVAVAQGAQTGTIAGTVVAREDRQAVPEASGRGFVREDSGTSVPAWDFYFLIPAGSDLGGGRNAQSCLLDAPTSGGFGSRLGPGSVPEQICAGASQTTWNGVEPSHTRRADLGLQLHWEGLLNMTRKRGEYTIEHVREAFEDSKTV